METDYSKTVNLPKTQFPMRADLPKREPVQIGLWESRGVYRKMLDRAKDGAFVLHDGPPYANGHIHIGHALNKILKDMVVKSRALAGLRTPYVPGWDCHGLPIEHALLKEMKMDKRAVKDIVDFRAKARHFAKKFIDIQREEFRRLEILGDWFRPYDTMSHSYEARVLRAFRLLFEKGYIYRGLKSVGWCFHCETALAEAEVEYREKLSPSIYVALPVASSAPIEEALRQEGGCGPARAEVVVWTTTPWTLPGNMAVAFHPDLDYVLAKVQLQAESSARYLVLGRRRLEPVLEAIGGKNLGIFGSWKGSELARADVQDTGGKQSFCERPFKIGDGKSLFVMADYVTAEDGTGIVHTAPGHGPDDFNTGRRYGLEILSPVDGAGRFTPEADAFKDFRVFPDGNESVCEALARAGRLLFQGTITHSYQHCWRCKNPIIFRATEQWFLNVAHEGLREKLLKAVGEVAWIPEASKARISSMIESRPDWCLSRQRLWGTPIPILYCAGCGEILKDLKVMEAIERQVERHGSDFWFAHWGEPVRLGRGTARGASSAPQARVWDFPAHPVACGKCGEASFRRETDILDVWVDSGASWLAVLEPGHQVPCDLYLEGSDQHRGWFQSSLVLSVAISGGAPYKSVLTHGFVLDDQGRAMHKSLGNVVSPQEVIGKFGADVLRLWVALADYSDDVRLSAKLLEGPTEAYRKIRNTLRYLLGNLSGFSPAAAVDFQKMRDLDRYILHRFSEVAREARAAYDGYRFRAAARVLSDFCNLDLSSFYLDVSKDRLYTLAQDAPARRSAQTAMYEMVRGLVVLLAPILSFTAEEAWAELRRMAEEAPRDSKTANEDSVGEFPESVFLSRLPEPRHLDPGLAAKWDRVLALRARTLKSIEEARASGKVGSSLEAKVLLKGGLNGERDILEAYRDEWPEILIVSQVEVLGGAGELSVEVAKADGSKCARCWRYQKDVGQDVAHPALCARCVAQISA